jgi:DNA-binding NarL/FixJ family response regulator
LPPLEVKKMRKYRIVIADDHEITRIGIKSILASTGMYEVCGEAGDGHEAIEKTCQLKPDLLILDVGLPQLNGVEVARRIELESAHTSILMFTEVESERLMLDALRLGVKGSSSSPRAHVIFYRGSIPLFTVKPASRRGLVRFCSTLPGKTGVPRS